VRHYTVCTSLYSLKLDASKHTWRSPVYDHFNISLEREANSVGSPKSITFVFTCRTHPETHSAQRRPRMATSYGTKNIRDSVKHCDKFSGASTLSPAGKRDVSQTYTPAAHRALIAQQCAKNCRPFNSVTDKDYVAEVEMLRPGTTIPSPSTVSRDVKAIYAEVSKLVRAYFLVRYNYSLKFSI
jgi:hypothetical protein